MFKFNKSSGQASRLLLVLAIVIFVAVIITFLIIRMAEKPVNPSPGPETPVVPLPIYETTMDNIRFIFESGVDRGQTLKVSEIKNSQFDPASQKNVITGEKFIQVTVGAQNKGTANTEPTSWDIGNIVDSEGRNFVPVEDYIVAPWLPNANFCGVLLKPAFDPTPCTKIYEVSKQAIGLKINVISGLDKKTEFLLDLIIQ